MPTNEETKELIADTSKRGQPIKPEVLAEAEKSIAGDTNESTVAPGVKAPDLGNVLETDTKSGG